MKGRRTWGDCCPKCVAAGRASCTRHAHASHQGSAILRLMLHYRYGNVYYRALPRLSANSCDNAGANAGRCPSLSSPQLLPYFDHHARSAFALEHPRVCPMERA